MRTSALATLLLTGCATSRAVMAPDGSNGYFVECPRDQSLCIEEAGRVCPRGYDVLGADSTRGALVQSYGNTLIATPTYRGSVFVKCWPSCPDPDLRFRDRSGRFTCVPPVSQGQAFAAGWTPVP